MITHGSHFSLGKIYFFQIGLKHNCSQTLFIHRRQGNWKELRYAELGHRCFSNDGNTQLGLMYVSDCLVSGRTTYERQDCWSSLFFFCPVNIYYVDKHSLGMLGSWFYRALAGIAEVPAREERKGRKTVWEDGMIQWKTPCSESKQVREKPFSFYCSFFLLKGSKRGNIEFVPRRCPGWSCCQQCHQCSDCTVVECQNHRIVWVRRDP